MRSEIKAALERNAKNVIRNVDPQSYRRKLKAPVFRNDLPRFRRKLSEEEGVELLKKHAPNWREHLGDPHVQEHILNHV